MDELALLGRSYRWKNYCGQVCYSRWGELSFESMRYRCRLLPVVAHRLSFTTDGYGWERPCGHVYGGRSFQ